MNAGARFKVSNTCSKQITSIPYFFILPALAREANHQSNHPTLTSSPQLQPRTLLLQRTGRLGFSKLRAVNLYVLQPVIHQIAPLPQFVATLPCIHFSITRRLYKEAATRNENTTSCALSFKISSPSSSFAPLQLSQFIDNLGISFELPSPTAQQVLVVLSSFASVRAPNFSLSSILISFTAPRLCARVLYPTRTRLSRTSLHVALKVLYHIIS